MSIESKAASFATQLTGDFNFDNVMAAVCVGRYFQIPEPLIQEAIGSYKPSNNRSQLLQRGSNTFILDAYNANPSSMQAAIDSFDRMPVRNKVLILGGMAELGSAGEAEHREILERVQIGSWKQVILVGNQFGKPPGNDRFKWFEDVSKLKSWFLQQSFEDHHFLLKGSRVIGLEKLLAE